VTALVVVTAEPVAVGTGGGWTDARAGHTGGAIAGVGAPGRINDAVAATRASRLCISVQLAAPPAATRIAAPRT
jgi:hypothetical protein